LFTDGHNIVPCWHASPKLEVGARTIRNKINSQLDEFLTQFPPVVKHPYKGIKLDDCETSSEFNFVHDIDKAYGILECDRNVKEVKWALPGYKGAIAQLESFIQHRLKFYNDNRNDPNTNVASNLSPWFHFGQISVQRAILELKKYSSKFGESVKSFMEEAIVRRELAENFCYFEKNYDNINGAAGWAKETLVKHSKDARPAIYTLEQLDNGKTSDQLWNAAQLQMRLDGKMHGFLRMYWAKKILEWTKSPEQALEFSIYLNDR
jgi:deoxyribodipyrimidine photo-lyase